MGVRPPKKLATMVLYLAVESMWLRGTSDSDANFLETNPFTSLRDFKFHNDPGGDLTFLDHRLSRNPHQLLCGKDA